MLTLHRILVVTLVAVSTDAWLAANVGQAAEVESQARPAVSPTQSFVEACVRDRRSERYCACLAANGGAVLGYGSFQHVEKLPTTERERLRSEGEAELLSIVPAALRSCRHWRR